MGDVRQLSGIKAIEEKELDNSVATSSKVALSCTINSEVGAVLAVMRRNVRWGGRYVGSEDNQEHPLIQSLKTLRRQIFFLERKWHGVDPIIYLKPFLDVIQSDETGAPITGVALSSVYKILTLEILELNTRDADKAMHSIVDAVTSCRFEVTDPASEEVVLMKILQVLVACMKCKASMLLNNQHVCTIVNTCFRVVHQAGTKGELLQRFSHHTMHELVKCIFSRLPDVDELVANKRDHLSREVGMLDKKGTFPVKQASENGDLGADFPAASLMDNVSRSEATNGPQLMSETYGVPCMVEIFHFLCSLLNITDQISASSNTNPIAFDEDVPLFALRLINSAIELGGSSIKKHPKLLSLVQDELFSNLMRFGVSMSPLIVSMVCSIVLNLYQHLRTELKLQFEAFFFCVILRLAKSKYGSLFQQQEVALEALVDFCRQDTFMPEMFVNLDCDITCNNVFEELANLLSKSAFPVNCPLSPMHILALDGLIAVIQGMANRITDSSPMPEHVPVEFSEYRPFWTRKCENYSDPGYWVGFIREQKYIKRRLMISADHFNRDPKKGLEFLQGTHLLPEKLDPQSVACFFRYTSGLDKNLVGDFLGNHDEFCIQVLHEFAGTFDFHDMNLDTALRLFLETFRLPGESQKIQRVLEAFSEKYYDHYPHILANKDVAFILSYSLIMLNTDQHNVQVKKKMTEEDFIRNNRLINNGNDLPREYLSDLYHSICRNEIKTIPDSSAGIPEMTPSRWTDLMRKSKTTSPYIVYDSKPLVDRDMFAIMSGPTIAAISVVFDHAEQENIFQSCIDGFMAVAKISASHRLDDVVDDLVVSLCKFTTLLSPSSLIDEPVIAFGDDTKARLATETVFTIANRYGDYIHTGWRNILDCILRLHKLRLLPMPVATDGAVDDSDNVPESTQGKPPPVSQHMSQLSTMGTPRRTTGLMGRFSQLLSLDPEDTRSQPTEQQLAAHQTALQTVQKCRIETIFTESKFLQAESLLQLAKALTWVASRLQKGSNSQDDEDTAVFCLELLIAVTLNNRDRIGLLWQIVYDHIATIVQSTMVPCNLVEKAVSELLRICQRLLPYKEDLADELLRSLQLILKLDARVADAYCESITKEVTRLVKANAPLIKSQTGWRTITSLLSITARHPEASEVGFEALVFVMADGGAHLSPVNYAFFIEAARQFVESRLGLMDRSLKALDLMSESVSALVRWAEEANIVGEEADTISDRIRDMWMRLVYSLRRVIVDPREEVRNQALTLLQKCLMGPRGLQLEAATWAKLFDEVVFTALDELLETAQKHLPKDYRNMEGTLVLAVKLLSKVFLQQLGELSLSSDFGKVWLGVVERMERLMKAKWRGKKSEKLQELIPELLKNALLIMKEKEMFVRADSVWAQTWPLVNSISPSLKSEVFPEPVKVQENAVTEATSGL